MKKFTRMHAARKAKSKSAPDLLDLLGPDPLTEALRGKVREAIEVLFDEELMAAVGAAKGMRTLDRRGYRHGAKPREITTGLGKTVCLVPRGRLFGPGGKEAEWTSRLLPRYQRRARAVDAALLGAYLTGSSGRRIRKALSPLLRGAPLSKSAVSRIVGRLKALFEEWRGRSLAERDVRYLYLDAIALRVRLARKVVSAPVLVALSVDGAGKKEVLDLELVASEGSEAWTGFVKGLKDRGVRSPELLVIDGSPGLRRACESAWPQVPIQRCAVHKLRNLLRHSPRHAQEEVKADFHAIVYAEGERQAREARLRFLAKWKKLAPKVAGSLMEAGDELLTFFRFPESQWKALRTTNAIERLNGEFRRRVKTQGSLPDTNAAELLLFGLLASGQIQMRRIDGWREMPHRFSTSVPKAA